MSGSAAWGLRKSMTTPMTDERWYKHANGDSAGVALPLIYPVASASIAPTMGWVICFIPSRMTRNSNAPPTGTTAAASCSDNIQNGQYHSGTLDESGSGSVSWRFRSGIGHRQVSGMSNSLYMRMLRSRRQRFGSSGDPDF